MRRGEAGQLVECRECGGEIDTMTTGGYEHVLDEGREWWWCQECARVKRMERVLRELIRTVKLLDEAELDRLIELLPYPEKVEVRLRWMDTQKALAEAEKVQLG
jgi:Zn-finger protein